MVFSLLFQDTLFVGSSSAKIASKTSAAWVPESIMNEKKRHFQGRFSIVASINGDMGCGV